MKITQTWMDISDTQKSVFSGRTTKRGGEGGWRSLPPANQSEKKKKKLRKTMEKY